MVYQGTTDYHGPNVPPRKPWHILPWLYHHGITKVECTMFFGVVHLYHGHQLYRDIVYYKCTTPKNMVHFTMVLPPWCYQGEVYHGFWGGTFVTWFYMVQLITIVQMYHAKNQGTSYYGTFYHGNTMVGLPR
jgi:hypothetical protein